jgi:hypothetical protein
MKKMVKTIVVEKMDDGTICLDHNLLHRLLSWSMAYAKTDDDIVHLVDAVVHASDEGDTLTMKHYTYIAEHMAKQAAKVVEAA